MLRKIRHSNWRPCVFADVAKAASESMPEQHKRYAFSLAMVESRAVLPIAKLFWNGQVGLLMLENATSLQHLWTAQEAQQLTLADAVNPTQS